jgi:hypothetical protein
LVVNIPWQGNYSTSGILERDKCVSKFVDSSPNSFVAEAAFIPFPANLHATASQVGNEKDEVSMGD